MKKKLIPLFLLSIAVSFFFSCSNDPVPSSITDGKLSFNVAATSGNGIFQPLNYIPSDAANKMDATELSVWKKLSSCFYIDYSIINASYYKKNKMSFLRDMEKLYNEAKAIRKSPQKLIVAFPNLASDTKVSLFELNDSTAGPDPGTDSGSDSTYVDGTPINYNTSICERILYRFINADIYLCISANINITGTVDNPTFRVRSQSVFTDPSSAQFSGYAELTPANQGLNLDAKGRLIYRSAFTDVEEHYYIKIIPKS